MPEPGKELSHTTRKRHDLRSALEGVLTADKLDLVPRSLDIIGSKTKAVAIVELPDELKEFELEIADAAMKIHKNVHSVLAKESGREGEFRNRRLRLIAGDPDTEVVHKEDGCLFKLDPRDVYFSPRESEERERVSGKVADGESVLVMFSGVGPFPIRIAKRHANVRVTAVELNPRAHNYCVENVCINRVEDRVTVLLGDVREICPKLGMKYDRVLMPLPKGAHAFLNVAMPMLREGGVLHLYHWGREPDLFSGAEELLARCADGLNVRFETLERVKVSQYSPRVWKIRLDSKLIASQKN
jgi:tRNA (guanine37-N1)-methyltransferase